MSDAECEECPTCGQRIPQTYARPLTRGMVTWLMALAAVADETKAEWVHARQVAERLARDGARTSITGGGDYAKLSLWGLIEAPNPGDGRWRLTSRGRAFLNGELAVARRVLVRLRRYVGEEGPQVTLREILYPPPEQSELFRRRRCRTSNAPDPGGTP